jgi:BirA family biotin operon repressor/biotin-[acetyl-CoA-carboxylase] ligase
VIVGIGVNASFDPGVLPKLIRPVVTTLKNELGRSIQLEQLLKALLEKLETLYNLFIKEGFNPILKEWKIHATFLGKMVEVSDQHRSMCGLAWDIDQEGALILKLHDGTLKRFVAGSVFIRKSEV